ncbi:MAG: aminotransferase class I/II-fold pyridoxal phosphate-dependent enzyme [Actinomycetia bacterium]|nr:aminotransferase class I/II-fold pyridoxal phosphate-dependent enzyme [Actinomycetes bacterium]
MRVSPILKELGTYPFVEVDQAKRRALAAGRSLIDFGLGEPREPVEPFIRDALIEGLDAAQGYPRSAGLPKLREAIATWTERRFGVALNPEREIVPTLGSKEAIFSFAHLVVERGGEKDTVITTEPGYPVADRGARFAGARVTELPLRAAVGFLPDLDAVGAETWSRTALVWLNYPNNPTAAVATGELYERISALAAQHDFIVASDEAYSEIYFDAPPVSALQCTDRSRIAVFNSLSKRSSMAGYRSGFLAASPEIMAAVRTFRPMIGATPQEFVQRASLAAWLEESHVERMRERYRQKRELLLSLFGRAGRRVAGAAATMFLWVETEAGETSTDLALRLLDAGVVVTPGSALGPSGEGYIRLALVPTFADCQRAVTILEDVL